VAIITRVGNGDEKDDDKKKKGAGGLVLLAVAAGIGGYALAGGGDGPTAGRISVAKQHARQGDYPQAMRDIGLTPGAHRNGGSARCETVSRGKVQAYFRQNPCRSLRRMRFTVSDGDGHPIAISIAWVTMPTASQAAELKRVEDSPGAGDIEPLTGSRPSGEHYGSRRAGTLLVIAQADGNSDGGVLDAVADILRELPLSAG
jgi:hypothetical protein